MDNDDLFETFCAAKRIAVIPYINGYFTAEAGAGGPLPWLQDRRSAPVNPYYSQTASGLFLEIYYGIPGKIWTPWGYWDCWGSGRRSDLATEKFFSHLDLEVHQKLKTTQMGTIGPVYKILAVEGDALPEPVVRDRSDYLDLKAAKAGWKAMLERFESKAV
jgi:hypothetical protein